VVPVVVLARVLPSMDRLQQIKDMQVVQTFLVHVAVVAVVLEQPDKMLKEPSIVVMVVLELLPQLQTRLLQGAAVGAVVTTRTTATQET
jgi:hypothetical protein